MAARVIGSGVVKSGSPMVRLMTSFISASMSKKRRMPDGGMSRMVSDRNRAGASALVAPVSVLGAAAGSMLMARQSSPSR